MSVEVVKRRDCGKEVLGGNAGNGGTKRAEVGAFSQMSAISPSPDVITLNGGNGSVAASIIS